MCVPLSPYPGLSHGRDAVHGHGESGDRCAAGSFATARERVVWTSGAVRPVRRHDMHEAQATRQTRGDATQRDTVRTLQHNHARPSAPDGSMRSEVCRYDAKAQSDANLSVGGMRRVDATCGTRRAGSVVQDLGVGHTVQDTPCGTRRVGHAMRGASCGHAVQDTPCEVRRGGRAVGDAPWGTRRGGRAVGDAPWGTRRADAPCAVRHPCETRRAEHAVRDTPRRTRRVRHAMQDAPCGTRRAGCTVWDAPCRMHHVGRAVRYPP